MAIIKILLNQVHVYARRRLIKKSFSAYLFFAWMRWELVRRRIARWNILNAIETISALHAKVAYILKNLILIYVILA